MVYQRDASQKAEQTMFCVLFEVHPKPDQWDAYLGYAGILRPELERVDGFIDNTRYRSLTRDGWLLSLSGWRDEKALVRWRTHARHHAVQENGRAKVFLDYHLRVGQVTRDTRLPETHVLQEQRLDETEVGDGTTVSLVDARRRPDAIDTSRPSAAVDMTHAQARAEWLGLDPDAHGLVAWDVFEAVLTPNDFILLMSWRDHAAAEAFERTVPLAEGARRRRVRVLRDYGMFDRREAPQYYPDVAKSG